MMFLWSSYPQSVPWTVDHICDFVLTLCSSPSSAPTWKFEAGWQNRGIPSSMCRCKSRNQKGFYPGSLSHVFVTSFVFCIVGCCAGGTKFFPYAIPSLLHCSLCALLHLLCLPVSEWSYHIAGLLDIHFSPYCKLVDLKALIDLIEGQMRWPFILLRWICPQIQLYFWRWRFHTV